MKENTVHKISTKYTKYISIKKHTDAYTRYPMMHMHFTQRMHTKVNIFKIKKINVAHWLNTTSLQRVRHGAESCRASAQYRMQVK